MIRGEKLGFTIIETLIVIAISGLMVAVATFAIGSRQQSVQFTDSMRSLQSFLEVQFSAAQSGVNDIKAGDGGGCATGGGTSGNCVMLGRIMTFEVGSSNVQYYSLLGDVLTADDEVSGNTNIADASPRLENSTREFTIPWGAEFIGGQAYNVDIVSRDTSYAFGFIRPPRSSGVVGVTYQSSPGDSFANTQSLVDASATYGDTGLFDAGAVVDAYYCFRNFGGGDLTAVITLANAQVGLEFYPTAADYPNCGL